MRRVLRHFKPGVCLRWVLLAAVLAGCDPGRCAGLQQAPAQPAEAYNPYQAEKELEVGRFYLRRRHYDAAIARFRMALEYKPQWALPHRWLGEAFEKKGDLEAALAEYRTYLNISPGARDAGRIRRRVAELERHLLRKSSSR